MNSRKNLMVFLVLTLAACSEPTPVPMVTPTAILPTVSKTPSPTPPPKEFSDLVIGFSHYGVTTEWDRTMERSMYETAEILELTLIFRDAQGSQDQQIADIREFIALGVDAIGIDPFTMTGWDTVLQEASEAGIPVILVDQVVDAPEELFSDLGCFTSTDYFYSGLNIGEEMIALMDGEGNTVEIQGIPGSERAIKLSAGFREAIGESWIEITHQQAGNLSAASGEAIMQSILENDMDVQGVFAHSDEMALGAIQAIKEAGLRPGVDIKIISINATHSAFEAMLEGELNCTHEANPLLAPIFYQDALYLTNQEPIPKGCPSPDALFCSDEPHLKEIMDGRGY